MARTPWTFDESDRKGGDEYARLIESVRRLQDRAAAAGQMPPDVMDRLTADFDALSQRLEQWHQRERNQWSGRRPDLPSRGNPLIPPFVEDERTDTSVIGRVIFPRYFLGGGGAVYGGAIPIVFDEVLGMLANHGRDGARRTAYLKVDYRRITPIDVELRLDATVDRTEGRKTFTSSRIRDDQDQVLCEAEGLFIALLPGQP